MREERQIGFNRGVRACIAWLHKYADTMSDAHARSLLHTAAFSLGVDKPTPPQEERSDPLGLAAADDNHKALVEAAQTAKTALGRLARQHGDTDALVDYDGLGDALIPFQSRQEDK